MNTITMDGLDKMIAIIQAYADEDDGRCLSWQWYAGLHGVGDLRLGKDKAEMLEYVNTRTFQRGEDGVFLMREAGLYPPADPTP